MPAYIDLTQGDIKGESQEQGHKDWVYVESVSLPIFRSIQQGATGVQRSNGETSLGDIVIVKTWDSSSPKLAESVANGVYIPEVVIHLTSTINKKNVTNLEVKLNDVILTGYSFHGSGGAGSGTDRRDHDELHRHRVEVHQVRHEGQFGRPVSRQIRFAATQDLVVPWSHSGLRWDRGRQSCEAGEGRESVVRRSWSPSYLVSGKCVLQSGAPGLCGKPGSRVRLLPPVGALLWLFRRPAIRDVRTALSGM